MEVRFHRFFLIDLEFKCFSHTPTNLDLNKLPKIERTSIKLDRLIGKGAFGLWKNLFLFHILFFQFR
jgi:hypothetical protein